MRSTLKIICVATLLILPACSTTTGTGGTECLVWRPLTWSVKDTPETIIEVKANNTRRKEWCK